MEKENTSAVVIWRESVIVWGALALAAAMLGVIFYDGLRYMAEMWFKKEEYSHAMMIPFIALFLIWQKKDELERRVFPGSWLGLAVTVLGLGLFIVSEVSATYILVQYSFLITLSGVVLAYTGKEGFRVVAIPLLILVLMIPLPGFLYDGFSSQLQLLSSQIGVWVIRLFGISVYLEGNVIDLGVMKLQVVEACSGLRYLFPLMTLGFIAAYFFKVAFWKRAIVFVSSIPITILMNSFRVGMIGVTVEYWGQGAAEGFLHDFEGWVVFMASTAVLVLEMVVLARIGKDSRSLREVFGLEFPAPAPKNSTIQARVLPKTFLVSLVLLVGLAVLSKSMPERTEVQPPRKEFSAFPLTFGDWKGQNEGMERIYVEALHFDDYIMANFVNGKQDNVNFYAAYYASQRSDKVPHSPRSCIPGGGWQIKDLSRRMVEGVQISGQPLQVNRMVIQMGDTKQLVYYWFQQRGRAISNEYLVKWFIFWDALTRNRTDGSLVRMVITIKPGQSEEEGDRQLASFTKAITRVMPAYIPD